MNKNVLWVCLINNSICTICWVALAIIFNKWWLALFSILFLIFPQANTQANKRYYRICDKCGKHSEYAASYNEALDEAKKAGWVHNVEMDKDYCPECKGVIE